VVTLCFINVAPTYATEPIKYAFTSPYELLLPMVTFSFNLYIIYNVTLCCGILYKKKHLPK